jgi:pre-mRNA-splicing factor 38A
MANRTDSIAKQIHGMNPQFLLETILRNKIYNTVYWKEKCFALTSETVIDRAIELKYIGGTYGGNKHPTEFVSLILKLLQIQPEEEIITEYLNNEEFKYLRTLAAFYIRLTGKSIDIYNKLEPLYEDYRNIRVRKADGSFEIIHMDEFIEKLLNEESVFEITLPTLIKRKNLEQAGELDKRVSKLDSELDLGILLDDDDGNNVNPKPDVDDKWKKIDPEFLQKGNKWQSFDGTKRYPYKGNLQESDSDDEPSGNGKGSSHIKDLDKETKRQKTEEAKPLDENSPEYWLEMRKRLGI